METGHKNEEHKHHVTPFRIYYVVWIGLLVMTVVTVASSYVDFGYANMLIALGIATFKALLVILFFMGLKYEGQENNVTFFLSFVFLAIFISLTISDLLYRTPVDPLKIDSSGVVQTAAPVDVARLVTPTPQLVAKGKTLYNQQCMTCHGADGKGDGPAAAALNPKPRNFVAAEGWKFGRTVTGLFKTITNGSPGTAMPPFPGLAADERFALAHYLHTLMPNAPQDTATDVQALQASLGSGAAKPRLSIAKAMEKMTEPQTEAGRDPKYCVKVNGVISAAGCTP